MPRTRKRTGNRTAIYLRKSTDKQEASIDRQRESLQRYAERNQLDIVGEYVDSGISGVGSTEKRPDFKRLVKDAGSNVFDVVLVWQLSRLSRSDALETAAELRPLRRSGVRLVTSDKGEVDWDSTVGQILFTVETNGSNEYVRKLAHGTADGQRKVAERGEWVSGRPPFGYDIGPDRKLIPNADAQTVKNIFAAYRNGKSLRGIVELLASCGQKRNVSWVRYVLANRLYVGDFVWGRNCQAKFYAIRDGLPTEDFDNGPTAENEQIIVRDNHPAIVSRSDFDAVNKMFASRRRGTTPHKNGGGFVLSGLVRCSCCGHAMTGQRDQKVIRYRCSGAQHAGKCTPFLVTQSQLVRSIVSTLELQVTDEVIEIARDLVLKQSTSKPKSNLRQLRTSYKRLREQIDKAENRLLEVDSDMVERLSVKIRGLESDAMALKAQIEAENDNTAIVAFDQQARDAMELVGDLKKLVNRANPEMLRDFFRSLIEEVRIQMDVKKAGSRNRYTFTGGEIHFCQCILPSGSTTNNLSNEG